MPKEPTLDDALCWLEQAGAIIDYLADKLGEDRDLGSSISLSLYGASSLIGLAQQATIIENDRIYAARKPSLREA